MATNYSPKIVTDGLVLCLDAANPKSYSGSGTTWTDLSKNGNNGTLVNGVGYSSDNKGALTFDAVNDYITNPITLGDILTADEEITFVSWNKNTRSGFTLSPLIYVKTSASSRIEFTPAYGDFNSVKLTWGGNAFAIFDVYSWNKWNYIVYSIKFTSGSESVRIYTRSEDGIKIDEDDWGTFFSNFGNPSYTQTDQILEIGKESSNYFGGNISSVMIYNKVLTTTEIEQNFAATRGRYDI